MTGLFNTERRKIYPLVTPSYIETDQTYNFIKTLCEQQSHAAKVMVKYPFCRLHESFLHESLSDNTKIFIPVH